MKQNIYLRYLDLPKLNDSVKAEIQTVADCVAVDYSAIQWLEQFHDHTLKAASQVYARNDAVLPIKLQEKIVAQYQQYFKSKVVPIIGVIENAYDAETAQSPPHCDRLRQTAINYIINTGGNNVLTCFYHNSRRHHGLDQAENDQAKNLNLDFKLRLTEEVWHSYNVQKYHSVENIQTKRIVLSLYLENNLTFDQFNQEYQHLFV